jgi:hypothetical protein
MRAHVAAMVLLLAVGCAPTKPSPVASMIDRLERVHGAPAWRSNRAVIVDFNLIQNDQPTLKGKLTCAIGDRRARFDLDDGTVYIFDGDHAWVSPISAQLNRARFHLITWPLFVSMPFMLHDRAAHVTDAGTMRLGGRSLHVVRATFDDRKDWAILYPDPETDRLVAFVYAFGAEPHAVVLSDYDRAAGVWLATRWTFFKWNEARGITGDPVGRATLRNIRFADVDDRIFIRPGDAREDVPPPPAR